MNPAAGQDGNVGVDPTTLAWLRAMVREVLRLPESEEVDTRTLRELGARSLHAVALQFRILQECSASIEMDELVGALRVADVATLIDERRAAGQWGRS